MVIVRPLCGLFRELCSRCARCSSRRLESNGAQERVEVGDDSLIQPVESMAFLLRETSIGGDWREQAGGERCVYAFEELQEDEADRVAVGEQAITSRVWDAFDEALRAKF